MLTHVCSHHSWPHTDLSAAKIDKLKDLAVIFLKVSLAALLHTVHWQPDNEISIFSGKSYCCNSTFTICKEYLKIDNLFLDESASSQLQCIPEIFLQIRLFF